MRLRPKSLTIAFAIQKTLEFSVLTLCMAAWSRLEVLIDPHLPRQFRSYPWPDARPLGDELRVDALLAALFFVFTLYPLITYGLMLLLRSGIRPRTRHGLAAVSALASLIHIGVLSLIAHGAPLFSAWHVSLVMLLFVYGSSLLLYPDPQAAEAGAAPRASMG